MLGFTIATALLASRVAACLLAFMLGGAAERWGAAAIFLNLLAGLANEVAFKDQVIALVIDAVTAAAFLPIAMRYLSGWLGAVMILYGLEFALHAGYAVLDRPRDLLHARLNNLDCLAISLCLVAGTVFAWRHRQRRRAA